MARVHIPIDYVGNASQYSKEHYAQKIAKAIWNFSTVTYQSTKLSLREFEGARARTAEINGCMICRNWRSGDDLKQYFDAFGGSFEQSVATHGPKPDEAYYGAVSEWRTSPIYSARERIAIEYAEGLGLDPQGIARNEDFWARAKKVFSDDEIVDLSYCIACWMGSGRVGHVLGLDNVCAFAPAAKDQSRDAA